MRALVLIVALLAGLLSPVQPVWAQETEPKAEEPEGPPPPPVLPQQVIAPKKFAHFTSVIFVLDVSSSMDSERLTRAAQVTRVFATDGYQAACITFANTFVEWEGVPSHEHTKDEDCHAKCVPIGWAEIPQFQGVLRAHLIAVEKGGGTSPEAALIRAIELARAGTLIVFASDGEFDGDAVVKSIDEGQSARKKRMNAPDVPEVPILSWTVVQEATDAMKKVGERGGAGLWREWQEGGAGPF